MPPCLMPPKSIWRLDVLISLVLILPLLFHITHLWNFCDGLIDERPPVWIGLLCFVGGCHLVLVAIVDRSDMLFMYAMFTLMSAIGTILLKLHPAFESNKLALISFLYSGFLILGILMLGGIGGPRADEEQEEMRSYRKMLRSRWIGVGFVVVYALSVTQL
ncbi:MAG: hypothetical protein H6619_05065 [Deltaproteobacteria bacterium]|nr:hypothetical protein [Deltaproteobacteria bacterium]